MRTQAITQFLGPPFLQHAVLAGTAIAAAAGLVGYFLVLRAQVFTGDALSHVAFTGALAALAFGMDARVGLFTATIGVAFVMGALGHRGRADDIVIGNIFAWILGLGAFFLTLYTTSANTVNGTAGVSILFGSIFGLSAGQATTAALIAAAVCLAMLAIARPLLFASLDEAVAAARGVPVRLLGYGFLVLVGVCTAEATQAVGALLVLGLLAAPAGTAGQLAHGPYTTLALSAGLAIAEMWAGLGLSYAIPSTPPSFAILTVSTVAYTAVLAVRAIQRRRPVPSTLAVT